MIYILESFAWILALGGLGQLVGNLLNGKRVLND